MALEGAGDLGRIERISSGGRVELVQQRPGKRHPELAAKDVVERPEAEGAKLVPDDPLRGRRHGQTERRRPCRLEPERHEDADLFRFEAAQREFERRGGRVVEPLQVVDGDEHGPRLLKRAKDVEQGEPDRSTVYALSRGLLEEERDLERPLLRHRKAGECFLEHGLQQVAKRGEGKLHLGT